MQTENKPVKVEGIYYDMYMAAIKGVNNVISRLTAVTEESNTTEVILWLEKLGKIAESLKSLEAVIFTDTEKTFEIRGNAKLNKFEMPEDTLS